MIRWLLLVSLLLVGGSPAGAQVLQSGTVAPGQASRWVTTRTLGAACTSEGSATTAGAGSCITDLGVQGPVGVWDGPSLGAAHEALWSWSNGVFNLNLQAVGGAPAPTYTTTIAGTTYQFPYVVGGIVAPATTTLNELMVWNNTVGTLSKDGLNVQIAHSNAVGVPPQSTVQPAFAITSTSLGDNTHFEGGMALYLKSGDASNVITATKGVLYGLDIDIVPRIDRNKAGVDDANGINVNNAGVALATSGISISQSASAPTRGWGALIELGASGTYGIVFDPGSLTTYGIDFSPGTFSSAPMRLGNNTSVFFRNAANTLDKILLGSDASDNVRLGAGGSLFTQAGSLTLAGTTTFGAQLTGAYTYGIDFTSGTYSSAPVRLPNNKNIFFRNAANNADHVLIGSDASNNVNIGLSGGLTIMPLPAIQLLTTWANNQSCTAGQFMADANYVYVCTGANTVKRAALSAF